MMTPDLPFWTRLLARLALEAACVVAVALLLDRIIRPPFWRRALWQSALICLLLLTASEASGFGRGLASFLFGHARPEQKFIVWTSPVKNEPLPLPSSLSSFVTAPAMAPLPVLIPEIPQPVWWPGLLWLAGAMVILGRVAAAQILFVSLRRRRLKLTHSELNHRVTAILQRLAVRRKICLLQSPALTSPIAFGVFRPCIGLPVDFAAKFTRAEQDAMLAHELAHLASRDPLWYLLADATTAALWWHPQAWWARRRLHRASELAADEAAVIFPEGPAALAGCLVTLGRQMTRLPAASPIGVEGGGFRSNLAERVQRLLRLAGAARRPSYGWRAHAARFSAIVTISAAAIALSGCLQNRDTVKQPTLQANLSESWNTSPASTVWRSALAEKKPEPPPAPKPVAALPVKNEWVVAKNDPPPSPPAPNSAPITEVKQETPAVPDASAKTNVFPASQGRQAILRKLRAIKITDLPDRLEQGLPLSDVLHILRNLSVSNDLEGLGINFMFKQRATNNPPERTLPVDASAITIKLDPTLHHVTLEQALDAIRQVSSTAIDYSVEDYAVWFFVKPSESPMMETRKFHVDPNTFLLRIKASLPQAQIDQAKEKDQGGGGMGAIQRGPRYPSVITGSLPYITKTNLPSEDDFLVGRYFGNMGINLTNNGSYVFYNQRTGDLLVRSTPENLDTVERVIELLNKVPPQVQIDVKFASMPYNPLGFNINIGTTINSAIGVPAGILTEPEFRLMLQAVEQRDGADILSMPRLTTQSGRQGRVALSDMDIVHSVRIESNAAPPVNVTNTVNDGPALDVLPTISADGFSIQLVLTAALKEFAGYESPGQFNPVTGPPGRPGGGVTLPVARYINHSISTTLSVWDGQTVVLGEITPAGSTNRLRQNLMVFITPTIIDAAGNRVHTDEDMPFAKKSIPPQAPATAAPK